MLRTDCYVFLQAIFDKNDRDSYLQDLKDGRMVGSLAQLLQGEGLLKPAEGGEPVRTESSSQVAIIRQPKIVQSNDACRPL